MGVCTYQGAKSFLCSFCYIKVTKQGRIQKGARGARAPPPPVLDHNDQDTLIEQSVSNSNKAVAVFIWLICQTINGIIIMYFNFIVILLLPSPTLPLLFFFFDFEPFQQSAPPLSKPWIRPCKGAILAL